MDAYKNYPLDSKIALDYVVRFGIPYESAYPYTGERDCSKKSFRELLRLRKKLRKVYISHYSELGCSDQSSAAKEKIYEGVGRGPMTGTIEVTEAFLDYKGDGILRPGDCTSSGSEFDPSKDDSRDDNELMTHALVILGMDFNANFFYVLNSLGPNWGNDGIGKIDCGMIYDILEPHIGDSGMRINRRLLKQPSSDSPKTERQLRALRRLGVPSGFAAAVKSSTGSMPCEIRIESIEAVNQILEGANKRVQPSVELFGVLRGSLYDRNHNLIMATLSRIGAIAFAVGPAVEKVIKGILSDVLKCLGDSKKHMRECTLTTLELWLADIHLEKTVHLVVAALMDARDLFEWLSRELAGLKDFSDAIHLLKPDATAMMDKLADVRRASEVCFAEKLKWHEMVIKNISDTQGPALGIVLDRLKPYGGSRETYESRRSISTAPPSKSGLKIGKSNGAVSKHSRDLALGGTLAKGARPETSIYVKDINIHPQALLNIKVSDKGEGERLIVRRFKSEESRLEQIQDLESDLLKYVMGDVHRRLLSTDFKQRVDGIDMLEEALPSISRDSTEFLDVLLRWFVLRLSESNMPCILKVLEFFPELFGMLRTEGCIMTELEAAIVLLCFFEKARGMVKREEGKPGEARAALRRSVGQNGSEQRGEILQARSGLIFSREKYDHPDLQIERYSIPRTLASPVGPIDWNEAFDRIVHGSPEQVLQSTIYEVDIDQILHSIHVYLQELGMEEISKRI